ncbi:MAG: amino acid ABC transporter permease [Actinomycetota bacterium]
MSAPTLPHLSSAQWLRKNLFRGPLDAVITILAGAVVGYVVFRMLRFVFVSGRWEIVERNLTLFMVGQYDRTQLWRPALAVVISAALAGLVAGVIRRRQAAAGRLPDPHLGGVRKLTNLSGRLWPALVGLLLLLGLTTSPGPWLVAGAALLAAAAGSALGRRAPRGFAWALAPGILLCLFGLVAFLAQPLEWDRWGGMMLNLLLAGTSIVLCFPLGVLLALGRRSQLPAIRAVCTGYIELFRGAPLIALLLMANVALGFFVPQELAPGKVVRAIVVFTLFTAAYIAEIVRGGLQSVPDGQLEAGKAIGLSPVRITAMIELPQALRNVIPAMVGQFISLFKDTTLAGAAMGFLDLLAGAEAATSQPAFRGQGLIAETLVFVALLFWVGSYTMSRESQRLELRLGVGQR